MKDALSEAIRAMDEKEEWLAEMHVSAAIRGGGEAIMRRDVVCIWMPQDPVEGDHEHTVLVLFCGGDVRKLAEIGEGLVARGYRYVVWCRGYKRGTKELQKHDLAKWAGLVKRLN